MNAIFALLAFSGIVSSVPTAKRCNALLENEPWIINNLVAFEATPASGAASTVSFHFCDINNDLHLDSMCNRTILGGGPLADSKYYQCDSDDVRFIYQDDSLSIERAYTDDCIGAYPYNGVDVFGSNSTDMVHATTTEGNMWTQDELFIKVTMEA